MPNSSKTQPSGNAKDSEEEVDAQDVAAQKGSDETSSPLSQSELEAHALTVLADRLQKVVDGWNGAERAKLDATLRANRQLWGAFYDQVMAERSGEKPQQMSHDLSANVVKLANFVFKRTVQVEGEPASDKLSILITINREIAAGLLHGRHVSG